jgi:hypothetical protein
MTSSMAVSLTSNLVQMIYISFHDYLVARFSGQYALSYRHDYLEYEMRNVCLDGMNFHFSVNYADKSSPLDFLLKY